MEVVARRVAGFADPSDHLAGLDAIAAVHREIEQMAVERARAVAVINEDVVAVAAGISGNRDPSGRRRDDWRPARCLDVDAAVEFMALAVATPPTVGARDHA